MDISAVIVSYDARDFTLACLRSLYERTRGMDFEVIVVDNASPDGSAMAIRTEFPQAKLCALETNLGFGQGVNRGVAEACGEFLLLLNPDTEVEEGAVERLLRFAREHPEAKIWGGRTVYEDGTLNATCCYRRPTLWSLFCVSSGLNAVFPNSALLNPESYGNWQRNNVRRVDVVTGCFLLIRTEFFRELGGFDPIFFMFGEEVDLCLRAARRGARPLFCPDAQIVHHGSRSARIRTDRFVHILFGKRTLVDRHFPRGSRWLSVALLAFWPLSRALVHGVLVRLGWTRYAETARTWREIWARRGEWLSGVP